ncbi:MAG: hypothetical protein ACOVO1_02005 [Chitinophagaceae bacterium]
MKLSLFAVAIIVGLASCKKNNLVVDKTPVVTPPEVAEFLFTSFTPKNYYVGSSGAAFKVPVGITSVSSVDRTIQLAYTSTTGATNGTHFNAPASVTIKAGQATGTLDVAGVYSFYAAGRVDSLKIKITSGAIGAFKGKDSVVLVMQRYCDVILTDLAGDFADTNEYTSAGAFSYGPYLTTLANVTSTGTTSASAVIQNIYDDGWNDINCTIDWSDPANFKVTIPLQATGKGYNGAAATSVRTSTTVASTFSSCDRSMTLYIDLVNAATGLPSTSGYKVVMK